MTHPFLQGAEALVREQEAQRDDSRALRAEVHELRKLLTERLNQLVQRLDQLEKSVLTAVNERLKEASTERAKLFEDFFVERVEEPIVREVLAQIAFADSAMKENSSIPSVARAFEALRDNLYSLLRTFGVERMSEAGPLEFDGKRMIVVKREPISHPGRHLQVQVVAPGYTRGERVLQRQNVVVFEHSGNCSKVQRS